MFNMFVLNMDFQYHGGSCWHRTTRLTSIL